MNPYRESADARAWRADARAWRFAAGYRVPQSPLFALWLGGHLVGFIVEVEP